MERAAEKLSGDFHSGVGFTNIQQTGRYDARNPAALKRLAAAGRHLRPFSQAIMEACLKASQEVNAETSAANPDYKKVGTPSWHSGTMRINGGKSLNSATTTS